MSVILWGLKDTFVSEWNKIALRVVTMLCLKLLKIAAKSSTLKFNCPSCLESTSSTRTEPGCLVYKQTQRPQKELKQLLNPKIYQKPGRMDERTSELQSNCQTQGREQVWAGSVTEESPGPRSKLLCMEITTAIQTVENTRDTDRHVSLPFSSPFTQFHLREHLQQDRWPWGKWTHPMWLLKELKCYPITSLARQPWLGPTLQTSPFRTSQHNSQACSSNSTQRCYLLKASLRL